jgi:hypothetical protein
MEFLGTVASARDSSLAWVAPVSELVEYRR